MQQIMLEIFIKIDKTEIKKKLANS